MKSSPLSAHVQLYHGSFDSTPAETLTLSEALSHIQGDTYRSGIARLQQTLQHRGKVAYDQEKKGLDAYTLAGTFQPTRGKEHLVQASSIGHLDYDGLTDVKQTREVLCSDRAVVYAFISPSGLGLKVGVHIPRVADDAAYKHAWQVVAETFEQRYGLAADPSGKDISRLCYVSWDPDCYVNPDAQVFPVPPAPVLQPTVPHTAPAGMTWQTPPADTGDRRRHYVDQAIDRAVQLIEKSYPSGQGHPGNRHHSRLKAARLLGGYVGSGMLSYDEAFSVLQMVVEQNTLHPIKSMKTVADGLRFGMRTPVTFEQLEQERVAWCAQHGYSTQQEGR